MMAVVEGFNLFKKNNITMVHQLFASVLTVLLLVCSVCQVIGKPADEDEGQKIPGGLMSGAVPKEMMDKCLEEVGMTKEELQTMKKNRDTEEPMEKGLCFVRCLGMSGGSINADGTLNIDHLKERMPPMIQKNADTIIPCMEKIEKISSCQDMKEVMKCMPRHAMKSD